MVYRCLAIKEFASAKPLEEGKERIWHAVVPGRTWRDPLLVCMCDIDPSNDSIVRIRSADDPNIKQICVECETYLEEDHV